jgi:hypothetical protein
LCGGLYESCAREQGETELRTDSSSCAACATCPGQKPPTGTVARRLCRSSVPASRPHTISYGCGFV